MTLPARHSSTGTARYTLLTGATGQLGRHLLADLLRCGLPAAVLVRSTEAASAYARIDALLGRIEQASGRLLPRPVVLDGELTAPGLGLSQPARRWMHTHVARVIHSAASLSFKPAAGHPDNEPYRTNVDALHELLGVLEETDVREMHAISTAYVCGLSTGRIAEQVNPRPEAFANDYEDSKWQAEQILASAGLGSLTITRPSIVIDSHDHAARSDRTIYSTLATLKMLMGQFGAGRAEDWTGLLGLSGDERKNLIEATWAARLTVEIVRHRRLHDRVYHVTAPQGTSIGGMTAAFHQALVDAGQFRQTASGPKSSATLDAMAAGFVQTFAPYFRDDPTFERAHTEDAVAATAADPCPVIDRAVMRTLADRMIAAGTDRPADAAPPASHGASFPTAVAVRDYPLGLIVLGPGGGDWSLDRSGNVAAGGGSVAPCRLIVRAEAWQRLQDGSLDLADALATLQATIESDDAKRHADRRHADRQDAEPIWADAIARVGSPAVEVVDV